MHVTVAAFVSGKGPFTPPVIHDDRVTRGSRIKADPQRACLDLGRQ